MIEKILILLALVVFNVHAQNKCSLSLDGNSTLAVDRFVEGRHLNQRLVFDGGVFEAWIHPLGAQNTSRYGVILHTGIIWGIIPRAYTLKYDYVSHKFVVDAWGKLGSSWDLRILHSPYIPPDKWTHVAFRTTHLNYLYVNGVAFIVLDMPSKVVEQRPHWRFSIGSNFTGYIDEVIMWNTTRSSESFKSDMNSPGSCALLDDEKPLLYLSFAECSSNSINATLDSSGVGACGRLKSSSDHHWRHGWGRWFGNGKGDGLRRPHDVNAAEVPPPGPPNDDAHPTPHDNDEVHPPRPPHSHPNRPSEDDQEGHGRLHRIPFRLVASEFSFEDLQQLWREHHGNSHPAADSEGKPRRGPHGNGEHHPDGHGDHRRDGDRMHVRGWFRRERPQIQYGPGVPLADSCMQISSQPATQCPYDTHSHHPHHDGHHSDDSNSASNDPSGGSLSGGPLSEEVDVVSFVVYDGAVIFLFLAFMSCCLCAVKRRRAACEKKGYSALPASEMEASSAVEYAGYPGQYVAPPVWKTDNSDTPTPTPPYVTGSGYPPVMYVGLPQVDFNHIQYVPVPPLSHAHPRREGEVEGEYGQMPFYDPYMYYMPQMQPFRPPVLYSPNAQREAQNDNQ